MYECFHWSRLLEGNCQIKDQALEQAAQGSGGLTMPGGVQKMRRRGTSGRGLVGMVVLGWQLDLMILEVFSKLNDSMIH